MKWKIYYQVPDVRDQVCECRKEAVNARGNLSRQNREEKCIKARREVLREKIKSTCGNMKSWLASRRDGTRTTRTSEPMNSTYSCTCEIQKRKRKHEDLCLLQSQSVLNITFSFIISTLLMTSIWKISLKVASTAPFSISGWLESTNGPSWVFFKKKRKFHHWYNHTPHM